MARFCNHQFNSNLSKIDFFFAWELSLSPQDIILKVKQDRIKLSKYLLLSTITIYLSNLDFFFRGNLICNF